MTRRLILSYLGITLFVLLVLEIPLGITFAKRTEENLFRDIERDARILTTQVEDTLEGIGGQDPVAVAESYAERTGGRVVIVDADGAAVADSDPTRDVGRDFSTRPEIDEALEGRLATGSRRSETLGEDLLYVAVPVASSGRVLGAVRVTYSRDALDDRVRSNWWRLTVLAVVVLAVTTLVGWLLSRNVGRPLRELRSASAEVASGRTTTHVDDSRGPPEVRELAQAFNSMSARVQGMLERERALTADVSHQLRTPLTALRLRLEALEYSIDDDGRRDLDAAITETDRLSRTIEALLAIARATEAGLPRTTVDAAQVARARIEMWTPFADERHVALRYDGPDRVAAVAAADDALDQILDNLLANALDVTPAETAVTVIVRREDNEVVVAVRDEGPGMTDAAIDRAFDRFFTTGGTGLGLALVRRLARASGGDAFLRRAEGTGLEAGVRLPASA